MRKTLFILSICATQSLQAQTYMDSYQFKTQTGQVYTPLTAGTNITSTLLWDDENFKIPMGFSAMIGDKTTNNFGFSAGAGFVAGTDTMGIVNTFLAFSNLDLEDRGWLTGTPVSPLRYELTGTAPNRVFKFEISNAGFFDEEDIYGTLNDYVNIQTWVYETSNIVEIRFGDSKITNPTDYYFFGSGLAIGYVKKFDLDASTIEKAFTLTGNTSSANLDSVTDISTTPNVLNDFPSNGTVYRFIPKAIAASIGEVSIENEFKVYPTIATSSINIESKVNVAKAKIYTITGQQIDGLFDIQKGKNELNTSTLSAGIYILEIQTEKGKTQYKFVKQ